MWDVRRLTQPGSFFVKYDLRDGFFAVPVNKHSRNRLLMRHPGTGRLMRCTRLGHHTLRRTGDKVARDTQEVTGAEKGEIDDHFGWDQRNRAKDSQLHYAGRRDRARRARITMML